MIESKIQSSCCMELDKCTKFHENVWILIKIFSGIYYHIKLRKFRIGINSLHSHWYILYFQKLLLLAAKNFLLVWLPIRMACKARKIRIALNCFTVILYPFNQEGYNDYLSVSNPLIIIFLYLIYTQYINLTCLLTFHIYAACFCGP